MDVFVARQPILGPDRQVSAYELLYRSSATNAYDGSDGETATSRLIATAFLTLGIDTLTNGRRAFVNFTRSGLVQQIPTVLPHDRVVVELLETIVPDAEVIGACRDLKEQGFVLALDDIVSMGDEYEPLLELADIVKVDFLDADLAARAAIADRCLRHQIQLLAEKVETEEDVQYGLERGYTLFQGYFFAKPHVVQGRDVPPSKVNYLRLMREMHRSALNLAAIEAIIKSEVALSFKLLKYLNSAAFGWRHRINSIRHALVAVGEREMRKWLSVLCLTGLADDKPAELAVQSIVRANFCESIAGLAGLATQATDLFLAGLFARLDAILDRPLSECLDQVSVSHDVRSALVEHDGPLAPVLCGANAYERGDWQAADGAMAPFGINPAAVADVYVDAVRRADAVFAAA